jgi:hypothetical protein
MCGGARPSSTGALRLFPAGPRNIDQSRNFGSAGLFGSATALLHYSECPPAPILPHLSVAARSQSEIAHIAHAQHQSYHHDGGGSGDERPCRHRQAVQFSPPPGPPHQSGTCSPVGGGPERRQLTTGTQLLPIERDQLGAAQSAGPTQREKGRVTGVCTVGRSLSRSLRSSSPMIGCALRAISIFAFVLQMLYHVTLGPFFTRMMVAISWTAFTMYARK